MGEKYVLEEMTILPAAAPIECIGYCNKYSN